MRLDVRQRSWLARSIAALAVVAIALGVAVSRSSANEDDPAAVGGEGSAVFTIGQTVVVATDRLKLRADAGLGGEVITVLEEDQSATVVDGPAESDGYSWYQIEIDGVTGWVADEFLAAA